MLQAAPTVNDTAKSQIIVCLLGERRDRHVIKIQNEKWKHLTYFSLGSP